MEPIESNNLWVYILFVVGLWCFGGSKMREFVVPLFLCGSFMPVMLFVLVAVLFLFDIAI